MEGANRQYALHKGFAAGWRPKWRYLGLNGYTKAAVFHEKVAAVYLVCAKEGLDCTEFSDKVARHVDNGCYDFESMYGIINY